MLGPPRVRLIFKLSNDTFELSYAPLETGLVVCFFTGNHLTWIVDFIHTKPSNTKLGAAAAGPFSIAHALGGVAVQARLSCAIATTLPMVTITCISSRTSGSVYFFCALQAQRTLWAKSLEVMERRGSQMAL